MATAAPGAVAAPKPSLTPPVGAFDTSGMHAETTTCSVGTKCRKYMLKNNNPVDGPAESGPVAWTAEIVRAKKAKGARSMFNAKLDSSHALDPLQFGTFPVDFLSHTTKGLRQATLIRAANGIAGCGPEGYQVGLQRGSRIVWITYSECGANSVGVYSSTLKDQLVARARAIISSKWSKIGVSKAVRE